MDRKIFTNSSDLNIVRTWWIIKMNQTNFKVIFFLFNIIRYRTQIIKQLKLLLFSK